MAIFLPITNLFQIFKERLKVFCFVVVILLKVDINATKICIKVELFSIKSSIHLIFKQKYFVGGRSIAYFLISEYCDLRF
nr:MAG TPA: hypothetical protein [Bacteriophage sp.]